MPQISMFSNLQTNSKFCGTSLTALQNWFFEMMKGIMQNVNLPQHSLKFDNLQSSEGMDWVSVFHKVWTNAFDLFVLIHNIVLVIECRFFFHTIRDVQKLKDHL